MIHFDKNGYLEPYEVINSNIKELEYFFVGNFPNSTTRQILFENYKIYIKSFQQDIFPYFEQWINGSFITSKENPNDIDIVTFLDAKVFHLKENQLDNFMSFSLEDKGLDTYIVPIYSDNKSKITNEFKKQWFNRFTTSKADENDFIYSKGFLSLNFEKNIL